MENLSFIQINKGDQSQYQEILPQYVSLIKELDNNQSKNTENEDIVRDLTRRINIQGNRKDMHFEMCYIGNKLIGFANFAIDLGTIYGLIEAGYGTILGFYITPEFRRKGYGRLLFDHIQEVLKQDGARIMYVCPDPVTGEPFWYAMGFRDSGKFDPDDKLPIYIKQTL